MNQQGINILFDELTKSTTNQQIVSELRNEVDGLIEELYEEKHKVIILQERTKAIISQMRKTFGLKL